MSPPVALRQPIDWVARHRYCIGWVLTIAAIAVRNLVALSTSPPGSYVDESSIGYNAWALGQHGVDEHGVSFPLYPEAFGEYKNPVYIYVLALLARAFGMSVYLERLPAAGFGLVAAIAIALTVRHICQSDPAGLITLLVAGMCPWLTLESRVGFEVIAMVAALSVMLCCLAYAQAGSWRWYLAAGSAGAVAVFAYSTGRLEVGLITLALIVSYVRLWRTRWWVVLAPIAVAYAILGAWMLGHPHALTERFDQISITSDHPSIATAVGRFLRNYIDYFGPDFLFFNGDANQRHNTGWAGMLLVTTLPLLLAGLVWCRRHLGDSLPRLLLLGLPLCPVAAALTADGTPHALRAAVMLPFLLIVGGCGVPVLLAWAARWHPFAARLMPTLIVLLIAVPGMSYLSDLYAAYPFRAAAAFDTGVIASIQQAVRLRGPQGTIYLIADQYLEVPYIQAAFGLLPPPPTRRVDGEADVAPLLAELHMVDVSHIGEVSLHSGDVVVGGIGEPAPVGTVRLWANQGAEIYGLLPTSSRTLRS